TIAVRGDTVDEPDEHFFVKLSNPVHARIVDAPAVGTLSDNDPSPSILIDDGLLAEGDAGTAKLTFKVRLSGATAQSVSVDYATADGTAAAPADYEAKAETLRFDAGGTPKTITIAVRDDTLDERDEHFFVKLSNPVNATIADDQAVGTIQDNDLPPAGAPTVKISKAAVKAKESTGQVAVTVVLSKPFNQKVSVEYATAPATATASQDFVPVTGILEFEPNEPQRTFSVPIINDTTDEPDETVRLVLSNAVNATLLATSGGVLTITDDDAAPTVAFAVGRLTVGESDGSAPLEVVLSAPSGFSVSVSYAAVAGNAKASADYVAPPAGAKLTFSPGQTRRPLPVTINSDSVHEEPVDENFSVKLSKPLNARLVVPSTAVVTIRDDDRAPVKTPRIRSAVDVRLTPSVGQSGAGVSVQDRRLWGDPVAWLNSPKNAKFASPPSTVLPSSTLLTIINQDLAVRAVLPLVVSRVDARQAQPFVPLVDGNRAVDSSPGAVDAVLANRGREELRWSTLLDAGWRALMDGLVK
ncbi:MAG: hypothetical protein HY000_37635, partial [Planctomycetes bacterium]|nr:hypothetical protein [Planctomycetota bacterium]